MNDNDILELCYIGKKLCSFLPSQPKQSQRMFVIRRKKILQFMFTNGLSYWTENVKNSEPKVGYFLSEMKISKNNDCIICYYQREDDTRQQYIKIFLQEGNDFTLQPKEKFKFQAAKNIGFDKNGKMRQIQIKIQQWKDSVKKSSTFIENKGFLADIQYLKIDKHVIMKELLDADNKFDHLNLSKNGQLIMCGRLIIQLDNYLREVKNIGVIMMIRNYSKVTYQFQSLLIEKDRQNIRQQIKKNINMIVHFDREIQPVTPSDPDQLHLCFLTYSLEQIGQPQTSIIKINSRSLAVTQIYISEFKIVHLSIKGFQTEEKIMEQHISKRLSSNIGNLYKKADFDKKMQQNNDIQKVRRKNSSLLEVFKAKEVLQSAQSFILQAKESFENTKDQVKLSQKIVTNDSQVDRQNSEKNFKRRKLSIRSIGKDIPNEDLQNKDDLKCCISLVSQTKQSINIEIIIDSSSSSDNHNSHDENQNANLIMLVNVCTNNILLTSSEVGWISDNKLILTLNNDFCLVNLFHKNWMTLDNCVQFCRQHVNMGVYVSILRSNKDKKRKKIKVEQNLVQSCNCIQLMEIASLARYAFIRQAKHSVDEDKDLLFFTPCEELEGANILSKLSNKYDIIKPYLERIDSQFVALLNYNVKNMKKYLNKSYSLRDIQQNIQVKKIANQGGLDKFHGDSKQTGYREIHFINQDKIHMFQVDISGHNAVDKAFLSNSILSIKAFVESIITLKDDMNFRNCFDKALILMIQRGMDVKNLVASEVFFPQIFKKYNIYSRDLDNNVAPFNGDIADLEFENPQTLFNLSPNNFFMGDLNQQQDQDDFEQEINDELFEVQFNFINMRDIEGGSKISISKSLKDCQDIDLFSIESIRSIIDYKWQTSSKNYFRRQFYIYLVFMITFFIECQTVGWEYGKPRIKDFWFWIRKVICLSIQIFFFGYEAVQFRMEGMDYWLELWNYIEVAEFPVFVAGSLKDIISERTTDMVQVLFTVSVMISLSKFLKLIRCFRQLSFLVMMIEQVVIDVKYFFVLFGIFLLSFGECYHILDINIAAYGRMPEIAGQFIQTLRAAMGDLALIDSVHSFDIRSKDGSYKNEFWTVVFIFLIFLIGQFFLFMIFMNFIIAVINESYGKIIIRKVNYDYLQRIKMIFEREAHFIEKDFNNNIYFPKILVVRKKKQEQKANHLSDLDHQFNSIKVLLKEQASQNREHYSIEAKFQREHITNQIRYIENEVQRVQEDMTNVGKLVRQLTNMNKKAYSKSVIFNPLIAENTLRRRSLKKLKIKSVQEKLHSSVNLMVTPDQQKLEEEIKEIMGNSQQEIASEKALSIQKIVSNTENDKNTQLDDSKKAQAKDFYKELKEENRQIREQQQEILRMQKEILQKLDEQKIAEKKKEGLPKLPVINFFDERFQRPIRRAINSPMSQAESYPERLPISNPMSLHQLSPKSNNEIFMNMERPNSQSSNSRSKSVVTRLEISSAINLIRTRNKTQQK